MTTKRRTYTADFKREAVQLWQTSGKTAAEIEQELGISAGLPGRWTRVADYQKAVAIFTPPNE